MVISAPLLTHLLVTRVDGESCRRVLSHAGSIVRDVRSPTLAGVPSRTGEVAADILPDARDGLSAAQPCHDHMYLMIVNSRIVSFCMYVQGRPVISVPYCEKC